MSKVSHNYLTMVESSISCKVCDSVSIARDTVVDGRQRYRCVDCNALFFNDDLPMVHDSNVEWLTARASIDDDLKAEIIEAYLKAYSRTMEDKTLARKLLNLIDALTV